MTERNVIAERAQSAISEGLTLEGFIREKMGVPAELVPQMLTQMKFALEMRMTMLTSPSSRISGNFPREVSQAANKLRVAGINRVPELVVESDEYGDFIASVPYLLPTNDSDFLIARTELMKALADRIDFEERESRASLVDKFAKAFNDAFNKRR